MFDFWLISDECQRVSKGHLNGVLMVSRRYMEGVWKVSGRCLQGFLKFFAHLTSTGGYAQYVGFLVNIW